VLIRPPATSVVCPLPPNTDADMGISMYRQRMRRERPEASEEEIEADVQAWLMRRPGDYPGPPSSRLL
jgi:Rv0078B-related antitoxin